MKLLTPLFVFLLVASSFLGKVNAHTQNETPSLLEIMKVGDKIRISYSYFSCGYRGKELMIIEKTRSGYKVGRLINNRKVPQKSVEKDKFIYRKLTKKGSAFFKAFEKKAAITTAIRKKEKKERHPYSFSSSSLRLESSNTIRRFEFADFHLLANQLSFRKLK